MEYLTNFELQIRDNENLNIDEIFQFIKEKNLCYPFCEELLENIKNSNDFLDCDTSGVFYNLVLEDSYRWYEHQEEMLVLSQQFPSVLFVLKGEGEENGDFWIKYFKYGKVQICPGKIVYDPFDENKLKKVNYYRRKNI